MRRAGICFWMMIKRMGKHPVYWLLLLLFPAVFFAVPRLNKLVREEQVLVGYIIEEQENGQISDGFEGKLLDDTEQGNLFQYVKYTDVNVLKKDILSGKLSGGIMFNRNFSDKLMKQDYWHCITLYLPEGMNVGGMIQEDVFTRVYQAYSAAWYAELLEEQGYQMKSEEILQKFSEYQKEGKVFKVNYEVYEKNSEALQNAVEGEGGISSVLSLRGILTFMTLLSACIGALDGSRDRKRGIGKGMRGQYGLALITVGAPILIAALFLAVGMLLGDHNMTYMSYMGTEKMTGVVWIILEFGSALLYGFVLWLLAVFFSKFVPEKLLEGFMPCFLLAVLICCPIFLNLGENIPLIGYLSKLFPITWYLEFWG